MKKSDVIHRPIYIDVPEIVEQASGRDIYKLCEIYNVPLKNENNEYLSPLEVFKALSNKIFNGDNKQNEN